MSTVLAGFWPGLRLALRRDRVKLPAWVLGIAAGTMYCASAIRFAFPDAHDLVALTAFMQGPAGVVLSGPGYGLSHPTHERVFAGVYVLYLLLAAATMSILLVVRHTRSEEESGALELVRSTPMSRHMPPAVATAMLVITNFVLALVCAGLLSLSFTPQGSFLVGAGFGMTGLVFGAVALITAQIASHSRAASGLAFLGLGLAFILRAIGDTLEPQGSALSWLSPLAWAQQTRAYVDDRAWPLALSAGFAVVCVAVAAALQSRRDLGAGLIPARAGRPRAGSLLVGPFTLALRLERGALLAWAATAVILGYAYGALTADVQSSLGALDNALLAQIMGGTGGVINGYLSVCLMSCVVLALCAAILATHRLAVEERAGRAELLLAGAIGRIRWMACSGLVALISGFIVLLGAGLGLGISAAASLGDGTRVGQLVIAAMVFLPSLAVVVTIALLGYAISPSWLNLAWVVAIGSFFLSVLGRALKPPEWLLNLSVFSGVPAIPFEHLDPTPLVWLAAIALGLAGLAALRFRTRDLGG